MDETMDQESRAILEALDACQCVIGTRLDEVTASLEQIDDKVDGIKNDVSDLEMIDLYVRDAEEQIRGVEHEVREAKEQNRATEQNLTDKIDHLSEKVDDIDTELAKAMRMLTQILNLLHQGPVRISK
eukprot:g18560.t1